MFVYFFQTILPANENAAIGIYVCLCIVSIIGSLLLPIETRGRAMKVRKKKLCIVLLNIVSK